MAQFTVPRQPRVVVAMKPETTAGTDVFGGTYTAADVLPVVADSVRVALDPAETPNTMTAGNLGRLASLIGPRTGRIDFSMHWRGKGVAYASGTRPETDLPLRGCRLSSTVDTTPGAEKVTYQPTNTEETMTIYVVIEVPGGNALSWQFVGCLGTFGFGVTAAGRLTMNFSFFGSLEERADITYVAGTLSSTPGFPRGVSSAFQIGSNNYAPRIQAVNFTLNNLVRPIPSLNAANGVAGYFVADREPRFDLNPEADREANSTWWAALEDGDPLKDMTFQVGSAQYNRLKIQAGAGGSLATVQVVDQSLDFRDGIAMLPTRLLATISAGNDDFALVAD